MGDKVLSKLPLIMHVGKFVHNMFHVSLLHKCINDPTHMLKVNNKKLKDNLVYKEHPIHILDRLVKHVKKQANSTW